MSDVAELERVADQGRAPGRRRDDATRRAILRAAFDIIEADGYRAFTIEGVAARSGAGKTTIYRWWPSKEALAVDAFMSEIGECGQGQDTGSVIEDLKATVVRISENLEARPGAFWPRFSAAGRTTSRPASNSATGS